MTFNDFLNQAWNDHATQPSQVAERISQGHSCIERGDQIPQITHLIVHVFGEHLGQWDDGIAVLQKLQHHPTFAKGTESDQAILRSIASLELAGGKRTSAADLSRSDQVRVLATAAAALSEQDNSGKAHSFFAQSLEAAQSGLPKEDPANRALAILGNNLASALEEKSGRDPIATQLMILAARTARKYWEIAGTWLQIERAEYRLSRTYLKAGDSTQSLVHAQTCLEIVEENNAPPLEFFFGYEALALAEQARGNSIGLTKAIAQMKSHFEKLSDDDKSWCEGTLKKVVTLLARDD